MTYLAGGNQSTIMTDVQQASRIMRLLVITDGIINSSDFEVKNVIRKQREDLICCLPTQRVWLFVKQMKAIGLQAWNSTPETGQFGVEGVEDALVEGKVFPSPQRSTLTLRIKAITIFEPPALRRMMYRVVDIEIFMSKRPNFGIIATEITKVEIVQEMALVFDKSGIQTLIPRQNIITLTL